MVGSVEETCEYKDQLKDTFSMGRMIWLGVNYSPKNL